MGDLIKQSAKISISSKWAKAIKAKHFKVSKRTRFILIIYS